MYYWWLLVVKWRSCSREQSGSFSVYQIVTIWPRHSITRYTPRRKYTLCPYENLYINIHYNPVYNNVHHLINGWVKPCLHAAVCHSAVNCMKLCSRLQHRWQQKHYAGRRSRAQGCVNPFMRHVRNKQIHGDRKTRGCEQEGEVTADGYRASFGWWRCSASSGVVAHLVNRWGIK